jgi:phage major head subunit gpT-like protein
MGTDAGYTAWAEKVGIPMRGMVYLARDFKDVLTRREDPWGGQYVVEVRSIRKLLPDEDCFGILIYTQMLDGDDPELRPIVELLDLPTLERMRVELGASVFAAKYLQHKWSLLLGLVTDGKSGLCYDGLPFFSASHAEGSSGTQSNLLTDLLDADAYESARVRMRSFKNDKGELLYMRPTHLLVCPSLEGTAREILQAGVGATGATNIWQGSAQLLVVDGLDAGGMTSAKAWAVADLSKPLKPFLQQNREAVSFTALDNPADMNVFMRDEYYYGANYRGNAGYAFWQTMVMSDGSGS